jgi:hypothetical protein
VRLRPGVAALTLTLAVALPLGGCRPDGRAWYERPLSLARMRAAPAPPEPPVPCGSSPFPALVDEGMRREAVRIGPATFYGLGYPYAPGRFTPGAPPLTVPFTIPPRTRVVVSVARTQRRVAGLDGAARPAEVPASAHRALTCATAGHAAEFTATFVVVGARCLPVTVTTRLLTVTRRVPFGRRC